MNTKLLSGKGVGKDIGQFPCGFHNLSFVIPQTLPFPDVLRPLRQVHLSASRIDSAYGHGDAIVISTITFPHLLDKLLKILQVNRIPGYGNMRFLGVLDPASGAPRFFIGKDLSALIINPFRSANSSLDT